MADIHNGICGLLTKANPGVLQAVKTSDPEVESAVMSTARVPEPFSLSTTTVSEGE